MEFIPDASLHSSRYRSSSPFLLPSSAQTHVDSILGFWQTLINYRCPCALLFSIQISSTLASTPSSSSSSSWWRRNRVPTRVLKGINLPPTPRPGAAASCPSSTYFRNIGNLYAPGPFTQRHHLMQICMYVHKGECKSRTTTEQAAGGAGGNEMKGGRYAAAEVRVPALWLGRF